MPEDTPARRAIHWKTIAWLLIFILVALGLRSHELGGQSLWWDESLSLQRAQMPLAGVLSNRIDLTDGSTVLPTVDNHPPLYFVVLAATTRVLGTSEFALRLPSLFFAILLIPLIFLAGKHLLDERSGLLAAMLIAISPMFLWFSHQARPYTMAAFLSLLSFYALLRLTGQSGGGGRHWIVTYLLATIAMLLTHYLTFFVFGVEILVLLLVMVRGSRLVRWAWPMAALFLAAAAILLYGLSVMPPPSAESGFAFVPLPILLRDLLNSFSLGLSVNVEDVIFLDALFLAVALAGLVTSGAFKSRATLPAGLSLLIFIAIPISLTYLAGYVRPVYMNSRHLIIIAPAFYLAVGAGLASMRDRRGLFAATLAVMLIGVAYSTIQFFQNPVYAMDDHRSWGEYLKANVQPGDVVVVNPPHIYELYHYYADSAVPWIGLPLLDMDTEATYTALDRLSAQYRNVWLAFSNTPPWGDSDRVVQGWLDRTLTKTGEMAFHSYQSIVSVTRYATRPQISMASPPITTPADIGIGGKLRFLGYDTISNSAQPGRSFSYSIYLRTEQAAIESLKISLRLLDQSGQIWAQSDQVVGTLQPPSKPPQGAYLREDMNLVLPLATPAGRYTIAMVVYSAASGDPLKTTPLAEYITLGQATVSLPTVYPLPSTLPITQRMTGRAAQIDLLGISTGDETLFQGDSLSLQAYWRAAAKPSSEYLVQISLTGGKSGATWAEQTYPLATVSRGTLQWDKGEVIRGQYKLALPRDLPQGAYQIRFALRDVASGDVLPLRASGLLGLISSKSLAAGVITVLERNRVFAAPDIAYPLNVNLNDRITVLGYDTQTQNPAQLRPGQAISVTVYLEAEAIMDTGYAIFAHLVDNNSHIWAQDDAPAGGADYKTNLWLPGEIVSDTLHITVPQSVDVAHLNAIIGLYDPSTLARLPVIGAGSPSDSITLFPVEIAR